MAIPEKMFPEIRCTVARDVASALRERAVKNDDQADELPAADGKELRLEARVLRSVARVIESVNRK